MTIAPGQTQLWHIGNVGADIFYRLSLPGHSFAWSLRTATR